MSRLLFVLLVLSSSLAVAADANRLAYLDEYCDPYYPHRDFAKLTTPQWIGEPGVECVVVLAIDDMRDPEKYEAYLRPIFDRLKQIDGRAPVSIMTNQVDPQNERVQQWLKEGVALDVHTFDHPCPCLQGSDFAKAKGTYDRCVDLLFQVPGNRPVAFRMPCCDSLNTPSPRFWMEVFNKTTEQGHSLSIDSSVFNIITSEDTTLPKEITLNEHGEERFRRYVPFPSYVNTIENYPYPYLIGKFCWQFPCVVPSDWSAQHVQKPNNPDTVRDWKLALDACVAKQGVYNLVFHPHGWIRNDQVAELVDYAATKYGKKVKFLNFRECEERLRKNLLAEQPLRDAAGGDNGVRLLDVNADGYLDVVIGNKARHLTRVWQPDEQRWLETDFPATFAEAELRFGVLGKDGRASLLNASEHALWHFDGAAWKRSPQSLPGEKQAAMRVRDLDGDGVCELLLPTGIWTLDKSGAWQKTTAQLPQSELLASATASDQGWRFVDLDADGDADIVVANEKQQGVWLFDSLQAGWKEQPLPGDMKLPLIARNGTNNGAWFHSQHLWVQNEDTNRLPDHVDRRSFAQLLGHEMPQEAAAPMPTITPTDRKSAAGQEATKERIQEMGAAKSPDEALKTIVVPAGFKMELVAAEPLIVDPVAFDWGPDGRLWVVEMRDYPRGIDEHGKPGGRVKVLTDKDGDGRYDEARLFLDNLPFPTGIKVWRKGVLITAAPEIVYAEDTDGDGQADVKKTLYKGFGEGNQQHRVNGLRWGLDGWLYVGNGDSGGKIRSLLSNTEVEISGRDLRIRPDIGDVDPISGQTQFSLCFDDFGNRFGGNNSQPVWHYLLEDDHLRRNPLVRPPAIKREISNTPGAAKIFPLSKTVTRFNDYHAANRFTSACGIEIYRDHYLGKEFAGNSFVCEPVHNLVHREVINRNGLSFQSQRANSEQESEFLASTDHWFRPVMARTGPDGTLYIADMYRLVIEHPTWIPEDWQRQLNLRAGDDKGRIYRVVRADQPPPKLERLDKLTTDQLVQELQSPSGTRRDLAQQLLFWRNDQQAEAPLRALLKEAPATTQVHALWTLAQLRKLRLDDVAAALRHKEPNVQQQAARLAASYFPGDKKLGEELVRLADSEHLAVQFAIAQALWRWSDEPAALALAKLAAQHVDNPLMQAAVLCSLDSKKLPVFWEQISQHPQVHGKLREPLLQATRKWPSQALALLMFDEIADDAKWTSEAERMQHLLALLRETRGGADLELRPETAGAISARLQHALKIVGDEKADAKTRVIACRLLFLQRDWLKGADEEARHEFFTVATSAKAPAELRAAAWEELRSSADFPFERLVHEHWTQRSQEERRQLFDALVANNRATDALLKLLQEERLAATDIDATRRQLLANHPSVKVRELIAKREHRQATSDRAMLVQQFQDVLALRGDVARGRAAFRKRCTACHKQEGEGRQIGPDLTALTDRSPQAMLTAILDPNRAVEDKFVEYMVITAGGEIVSGVLTSETGTSLTLASADGKDHTVLRSDIELARSNKKSLMPEGLERDLTKQELADVIAYVRATGAPPKEFAGNVPTLIKDGESGSLQLAAAHARIYGPKVIFEEKYKNLGWWQHADDVAEWSLAIPAARKYRVLLDYACDGSAAGNTLQLSIGGQTLLYKVPATGTWDDYRTQEIGTVELAAGPAEASARASGAIRSALMDLRGIVLEPVK